MSQSNVLPTNQRWASQILRNYNSKWYCPWSQLNTVVPNHVNPDHVPSLTSERYGRWLPVFTLDPQLKKILTFSMKDRYQLNYFICIKDFNAETITSLKLNLFSFFICCCQHHDVPSLTSERYGRWLPVFTLSLWQRQHIIVVDAVDYK
jgi:hypothetical protein